MKIKNALCLICTFLILLSSVSCDVRDAGDESETPSHSEASVPTETGSTNVTETSGEEQSLVTEEQTGSSNEGETEGGNTNVDDPDDTNVSTDDAAITDVQTEIPEESDSESAYQTESNVGTETDSNDTSECTHSELEWKITKNATCKELGSRDAFCISCGVKITTESIPTVAHSEEIIPGTPATCTSTGLSDGKKCSECGDILVEQQISQVLNHTEQIVKGTQPTCTEPGRTDGKICSVCSTPIVASEMIPALDHNEGDWIIDTLPTSDTEGSKHTECMRCQTVMNTETIPVISVDHVHAGKEWLVPVPPTCTSEGRRDFVCECGAVVDTETVPCVPHTEVTLMAVASTCISTGLTEGKQCSVCKSILVEQTPTAKSDHTEETVVGKASSCIEYGLTDGKKCAVCSTTLVSQIQTPPTGHTFENEICKYCGKAEPYGIWIVDGLGNPLSNIIIKILKDGNLVKMYQYKGEYLSLDIDRGNYTIELDLSMLDKSYDYDESLLVLTPDKKNTTIRLFESMLEPTEIYVGYPLNADYNAYKIGVGSFLVDLTPNDYTFLIFIPETAAIYTMTYESGSELKIGYHGSSFFVQGLDISEEIKSMSAYENGLSFSVYQSNIGGDMVFAIWSASETSCVLNVKNTGDPGTRLEDEPWVPYLEDEATVNKQLSASKDGNYTAIDLTDMSVAAVFNDADGYYHLGSANGPIIFIDLTTDSKFISSIQTICATQRMGVYIYDDNGKVAEKRSYNELFVQYGMPYDTTPVDEPIRIPLTKKLAEAIQEFGGRSGWWGEDPEINIFNKVLLGAPYNQEYAWLLYCGYYQ